ncbi:MAG TPA: tetratricopeptide repeat protein [Candidatus Melainabacteria bacterium]|nr:tetratricopeptide repeat protein [Candidatus Melainabacteria bacterium]HIN65809.1 tetratricopeptide repeat protein [Candidatus Obscuribacterales bacterium]
MGNEEDDLDGYGYGVFACLMVAKWLKDRNRARDAERFLKIALQQSDALYGESSPESGIVLLDLHDLFQEQSRLDEAEPAWERVRKILISGVGNLRNG